MTGSRPGALLPNAGQPGGPPSDARFVSFGDPAIDEAGAIVFTSTWSSAKAGRGNMAYGPLGITTGFELIPGARSFGGVGDPVIAGGHAAALGTMRRVAAPTETVLYDRPAGGALSYAIGVGGTAPETGGATFKALTQIGVADSSLAFLAQLNLNTGDPKTTADSDLGIWAQDATHALKLLLREGGNVGAKKIKTLVAFHPGNGSPGQGRGWALNVNGVTQVHALATFTDKSQALLRADNEGHVVVLSSTGPLGTGKPTLPGASFASYSFPALNALGDHAFLGTLTVGTGGVKATDSRGIFLNDPATGTYDAVVRVGDKAPGIGVITLAVGAKFSTLYDPVLADDGSLVFRSLLSGVRATNDSLWWQPAGGALRLLAQQGQTPAGSTKAGEKWVSFPSFAIAPNGRPIFTATVTGGAVGVWAVDYTGKPRPLFRTGDIIGFQPLTAFSILKALPGTTGMTRSFNGTQAVWRAVFKDGSSGIVETIVP